MSKVITWLKKNLKFIIIILVAVMVGISATWVLATKHTGQEKEEPSKVRAQVSKLMLLPTDEEPTLATVEDKAKLADKFLASKAENGDRILIYTKNHIVIVYRPGINKIAAVAPVTVDLALAESKGTSLTVVDGSGNPSKAQEITNRIKASYPDLKVTSGGKSNRQDFPSTLVIDNTEEKNNLVDFFLKLTSGKRGVEPLGEAKVTTDLLIIVGED